jgi:hypothetical protein
VACSAAPCGTVLPTATASGVATTYTAPTTPPAGDLMVTITATSVANTSVSNSAIVTVPAIRQTPISSSQLPSATIRPIRASLGH